MFGQLTYVIWLVLFIAVPVLVLGAWRWRALWARRRAFGWMLVGALVGGWAWDALAVRLGAWYYEPGHILGVWLGGLPLEEWLWIIGVTLLFGAVTVLFADKDAGDYHKDAKDPKAH